MHRECNMHERDEKYIQNLGQKTWREETTWKTWCRWDHNVRMDLGEIWWKVVVLIHLAQDRDQWWAVVYMVINIWAPLKAGNFLTSW